MMQLTDFFAPLNLWNLFIFIFTLVAFDAVGVNIAYFLKPPGYLRPVYWIWGLGVFIFLWLILHFFIPFWPQYAWFSLIALFLISLPLYISQKGPATYVRSLIKFPYPLIFILLAAKPLFFLTSAPPYIWDEMAYHFYSPARLMTEMVWPFAPNSVGYGPSMYDIQPHSLEVVFRLMFSLSKTYATARLLHFFLFFSAIYAIALFLKEKIGTAVAGIYSFLAPYLTLSVLTFSTSGYVDTGAAILANLFLIVFYDFLTTKRKNLLYLSAIILGLALSIKYTTLTFLGSVILTGTVITLFYDRKRIISILKKNIWRKLQKTFIKTALCAISLVIFFGGFWYINNFIVSGNPLYPLVFPCRNDPTCGVNKNAFFTGWTIPLKLANTERITNILFQDTSVLQITIFAIIIGILFSYKAKKPILRIFPVFILLSVFIELTLSKNFVGFVPRYFYHWSMLIPLLLSLPLIFNKKNSLPFINLIPVVYLFLLALFTGSLLKNNVKTLYADDYVQGYVRNYAMRRINLDQWLDFYFPQTNEVIKWCGKPGPMTYLLTSDPGIIWNSYEGLMRVYLTNCILLGQYPPVGVKYDEYVKSLRNLYPRSYVVALDRCQEDKISPYKNTDAEKDKYYEFNQYLVCNGKSISKNLYSLPGQ